MACLGAACDAPAGAVTREGRVAVHVVDVQVTTAVAADGTPRRDSVARDGSTGGVLTSSSLVVRLDRFLDPSTPTRQAICLAPTLGPVASYQDCAGTSVLLPAYDPVERAVTYHQRPGERLAAQTRYQLTVFSVLDPTQPGFRAFDGAPVGSTEVFEFETASEDPPEARDEWPGDRPSPCPPRAFASCALSGCHRAEPSATMGLDLSSPRAIAATAVGRVARESLAGEHADLGEASPTKFGRAMPLVDAGNPGNSYVLFKLLAHDGYASSGAAPAPDELVRLRDVVVVGGPMPSAPSPWIGASGLTEVSAWIAAGARTSGCE